MISLIVGRCHVSESNLAVIRYLLSRMKKGAFRKLPRSERRKVIRTALACHAENRSLYIAVMGGTL